MCDRVSMVGRPGQLSDHRVPVIFVVAPEAIIRAETIQAEVLTASDQHFRIRPLHYASTKSRTGPSHAHSMKKPRIGPIAPEHGIGPLERHRRCQGGFTIHDIEVSSFKRWKKLVWREAIRPLNDAFGPQPRRALGQYVGYFVKVIGACSADGWKHRNLFVRLVRQRRRNTAH